MWLSRTARTSWHCRSRLLLAPSQSSSLSGVGRLSWSAFSTRSSSFSATPTTTTDLVTVEMDDENRIATLSMNRAPANSLSLEMNQAIANAIETVEANPRMQGLVLCSSLDKIFCAGLDLSELYQPDADRLPSFWRSFQQVYLNLYGSRLATMAAISGHAPAGGCMLALSCDYRIMSDGGPASIGLNESQLGIVAPPWLGQQYIDIMGYREAELALSLGTLFGPAEALNKGLVDTIVRQNVVEKAKEQAIIWTQIPPAARVATKSLTRGRQIDLLNETRDQDVDNFCSFVTQDKVQKTLGMYLESLAKRKSK